MKQKMMYLLLIFCGIFALYLHTISRESRMTEEATIAAMGSQFFQSQTITPTSPLANKLFVQTSIARFTENPESALLSTPYYGEILYNHAYSFLEISPTMPPTGATPECWIWPDYIPMDDFGALLVDDLDETYPGIAADGFANIVWYTENCEDYLLASNRFRVWFDATVEPAEASKATIAALYELIPQEANFVPVPENIIISFYFALSTEEGNRFLDFSWQTASQAYEEGLEGEALLEALGGFVPH